MKKLSILISMLGLWCQAIAGGGESLKISRFFFIDPEESANKVMPYVLYSFHWMVEDKCEIEPVGDGKAYIMHDGEQVASFVTECNNSDALVYGPSIDAFCDPIVLPKGESYQVVLPAGTYRAKGKPELTNMEFVHNFRIPDKLDVSFDSQSPTRESLKVDMAVGEGANVQVLKADGVLLYRNGQFVERGEVTTMYAGISAIFSSEWAENGVDYKVVVEGGALGYRTRDDIVNDRIECSFVGTYVEPDAPPTWPSFMGANVILFDIKTIEMDKVEFYFGEEVTLGDDASIQFVYFPSYNVIKSVPAQLRKDDDCWTVYGDFRGFKGIDTEPEEGMTGLTWCLAAGSIVNPADNTPGQRYTTSPTADIEDIAVNDSDVRISVNGRCITVDGALDGSPVSVYGIDGALYGYAAARQGTASVEVGTPGIYIVRTGINTVKVLCR